MEILYEDRRVLVCIKPAGVLSTDEPGGMPELLRSFLGDPQACVRTVHRLDRPVAGVMVFARSRMAASILSEQVRSRDFQKEYLAVLRGVPAEPEGELYDLLLRSRETQTTRVVSEPGKDVQPARLSYRVLSVCDGLSLVRIRLHTGRTHQIRVQFSSRGLPLAGDRKYGGDESCPIALWSYRLRFRHPETGQSMDISAPPPRAFPWDLFDFSCLSEHSQSCNFRRENV